MVINRQGGQRRHIHAVFHPFLDVCRKFRIESVDAFYQQYRSLFQFYFIAAVHTLSELEIIRWQLHFLAVKDGVEVIIEAFKVKGIQRFVVIFPVFVKRCAVSVYEIVVKRYHLRLQQVGHQLDGQALCGRCLSR